MAPIACQTDESDELAGCPDLDCPQAVTVAPDRVATASKVPAVLASVGRDWVDERRQSAAGLRDVWTYAG